jgi:hypothetical protein
MTGPTLFRSIEQEYPTLIVDEAEKLNRQGATDFRAILNVGYRKGQTIPRLEGKGVKEFNTYCPKIFILIGDVYDTLRDRSMIITMRRAESRERFVYEPVKAEGNTIRESIYANVSIRLNELQAAFLEFKGLPFLMDRDEEIWTSLFSVAAVFCPDRIGELQVCAVDMATEKTIEARRHVDISDSEEKNATSDEYAKRLLLDLCSVFAGAGTVMSTANVIVALQGISVAPWRKFRGRGLTPHDMSHLLSRFGVRPVVISASHGRKDRLFLRGYRRKDVEKAVREFGGIIKAVTP